MKTKPHLHTLALLCLGAAFITPSTSAQSTQMLKLHARNTLPQSGANLGQSAAMNDRWIVLGEPGNDDLNTDVGAVHIYEAATGKWLRKLSNPEPESDAEFGYSVAVSGDLALIGAPYANTAGIAFLFDLKTGALIRTIRAGGSSQKRFGYSVALEGRRAAVGAPGDLHPLPPFFITSVKTGSVKVYADLVASDASSLTLYPSDSAVNDLWGFSVCMDGGLLLGGAPFHNAEKGAAYLFDATTGEELHKLEDSTAERAGWSVALAGGYAYAGAPYSKDALTYPTGMILKHQVAGMNPASGDSEVRLYPSALNSSDYMGYSLAAWGSSMIAGAPNDNDPMFSTQDTGRADLFSFSSVESMTKPYRSIQAVDRQANDELGTAVCMWGNRVLMTAPYDDDLGDNAGAAYLITACPHFMDLRPLAVTNSQAPGLLDARHSLLGEAYACPDSLGAMFTSSLIGSGLAGGKGSAVFSSNDNSNNDYTPALSLVTGMDLGGMGLPGIKATSYYGFNPNNEQLYHAKLAGTGVNTTNDVLLLKDNGFTVSPLYREGTAVSSLGGAVVASWTQMIQPLTGAPFLLSQLKIGTAGVTAANDTALLQITGAGMAVSVMREGGMTAAGVPLASIQRMDANESGRCLVHATLQAPVTSNTALIRADTNNMMQQTVIARKGDMAPGVPNGVFSSFIGETYVGGNISFRATVTGQGITAANNEGLWYFKGNNNNLIVRTGDQVESMPTGILWSKILGAWMHEDSGIMVYGRIKGPGVAPANDTILWLVPEVPERVVLLREGDLIGGGSTYRLGPMQRIAFNPGGGYMVLASLLGAPAYSDTVLLSGETYDSLTDNPILRRPVLRMREGTLYDRQEGIVSKLTSITWSGPAFDPFQKAAHPHPMGTAATLQLGYSNGTKEIVWGVP